MNIGQEELVFESGSFTHFGIQTLTQVIENPSTPSVTKVLEEPSLNPQKSLSRHSSRISTDQSYVPDYSIKATMDVIYLKIKRSDYASALKASLMGKKVSQGANEGVLEKSLEKSLEVDGESDADKETIPLLNLESKNTDDENDTKEQTDVNS